MVCHIVHILDDTLLYYTMPNHYAAVTILEGGFVHSQELYQALYIDLIHIHALYKVTFRF